MNAAPPDTRRIALILDPAGSGRMLHDVLPLMFTGARAVQLDAVLFEEQAQRYAAELPFVRQYSALTIAGREFHIADLELAMARRKAALARATAAHSHVSLSIRRVCAATEQLQEITLASDITLVEPLRRFGQALLPFRPGRQPPSVLVAYEQPAGGPEAVSIASELFGVIAADIRQLRYEGPDALLHMTAHSPSALVLAIATTSLTQEDLARLRRSLSCPIVLIRTSR